MKFPRILSAIIFLSSYCYGQELINLFADANIRYQAVEGQYLWVGTFKYLSKLNTLPVEMSEIYWNFRTGDNNFSSIEVDRQGIR